MNSKKIAVSVGLIALLGAGLYFGGRSQTGASQGVKVVAIATFVSHPALDSLLENLKTELGKQGFKEGQNI